MSMFSKLTGHDAKLRGRQIDEQRHYGAAGGSPTDLYYGAITDERNGGGWQDAFNKTAGATLANALPDLRQNLQMTREDGIRRGISTGDLGTSNEGDLVSSWGRNLANAFAGQSFNAYDTTRNRYLDLITGQIDRDDSNANAGKNRRAALWGAGINAVGQAAGAAMGGH
jgi:hypothetical protein